MAVPLQAYPLTTQNARVSNLAGDSSTVRTELTGSSAGGADAYRADVDDLIERPISRSFSMRCKAIVSLFWNRS